MIQQGWDVMHPTCKLGFKDEEQGWVERRPARPEGIVSHALGEDGQGISDETDEDLIKYKPEDHVGKNMRLVNGARFHIITIGL
jgi:hypothetical protein